MPAPWSESPSSATLRDAITLASCSLVAHNTLSQTVYISTATISLSPSQNVTVYPSVFGFPPGTTLNSTTFMDTFGGVALSSSAIFVFTTF
jgi:hypothetical protein